MANLYEMEASWLRSALIIALEDLRQAVDFLAQHEHSNLDTKCFYYRLFVRCLGLQQLIAERKEISTIQSFMCDALEQLESLVDAPPESCFLQNDPRRTFPGLTELHHLLTSPFEDPKAKLAALRECITFGNKDDQDVLFELLSGGSMANSLSQTQSDLLEDEFSAPRKTRQKPPDDVRPAANSLFKILQSKRGCTCEPVHKYVVQLSLETHRAQLKSCDFDLYFGLEKIWQEARVQTSAPLSLEIPSVSIMHHDTLEATHRYMHRPGQERLVNKLCKDIINITKRFPDYRLRFRMEKDRLWKLQSEESDFVIDKSQSPISLTQLLAQESVLLNEKIKRILSVLLGYAVLHLHETSWLSPDWGSRNVMFFRSFGGLPMRPYIRTELSDDQATGRPSSVNSMDDDEEDFDPDDLLLPPYPCLIGLAVVLMELHKAAPLETLSRVYNIPETDEEDPASRFIIAKDIFRCCNHEFTDQTRMAIHACLDPNIGLGDNGYALDGAGLQGVLYERIVQRLEDELEQGFSDVSVDQLDTLIQKLDLANGGQPIRNLQRHEVARLGFPTTAARSLNESITTRRVRVQFSTATQFD
ncbi:hypothetical protein LQW54_005742 [Pestalotiopsis sp. IQ-011]